MKNGKLKIKGFTLIELMIVVAIMGILLGISIAKMGGILNKIQREQAKGQMKALASALKEFYIDVGCFPPLNTTEEAWTTGYLGNRTGTTGNQGDATLGNTMTPWEDYLVRGINSCNGTDISKSSGSYIGKRPRDPWRHRYLFQSPGPMTDIIPAIVCMGPHGPLDGQTLGTSYTCPAPRSCGQTHTRGTAIASIWKSAVKTAWPPDKEGFSFIPRDGNINNLPENGGDDYSIVLWLGSK